MSDAESWTVGRLLTWTTDYLKRRGSPSPRLDAEILLAQARDCERIALYTAFNEEVSDSVRGAYRELVRRRAEGEPVAYLVGYREFYSLCFRVTPDVLIPRPETEHLVVHTLDAIRARPADGPPARVLDVGTGSGAIAISIARHAPACRLTAVDVSAAALQIARENAATHQVAERIEFLESDLLAAIGAGQRFDVVVSNPPYVSRAEWEQLVVDIRKHEPPLALVGGETGVETIARLVPQAAAHLVPGGWLLLEISPMIEAAVRQVVEQGGAFTAVEICKDLAGLPRLVKARRAAG